MAAGIGFFLAFIAMKNAGIIEANAATFVTWESHHLWTADGFCGLFAITHRLSQCRDTGHGAGIGDYWITGQATLSDYPALRRTGIYALISPQH